MSRQEAFDIVKTTILNNDTSNIDLYGSKNIIPSNSTIGTMYQNITSPDYPTWMFFIDDDPFQNWGHPARFVFVDGDGQTIVQTHDYPPFYENMDVLIRKIINVPTNSIIQSDAIVPLNTSTSENDYAVIISGGYTVNSNYERYWNDCAAIYSTLVNVYNYNKSHIYY
jgi:hypothetical protein